MTIQATFQLGPDMVIVEIDANSLIFLDASTGMIAPLEGLRINRAGVLKEFPDLEQDEDWRKKAIDRLKHHVSLLVNEDSKIDYVIRELVKFGYTPLFKQKAGWRPVKLKLEDYQRNDRAN